MSTPELAPARAWRSIAAVWVSAAVIAVLVGLLTPPPLRMEWITVGFGLCLLLAFGVQLSLARSKGFIDRMALSMGGALLIMGLVTCGFALAAVVAV